MDAKIILGRILQRLIDQSYAQVLPLNSFGFIELKSGSVLVSREAGQDTIVSFGRLELAIQVYQQNPGLYESGPSALRPFGITHLNSPIFALLHLLPKETFSL